jgi:peptidyl-prolyl cis-trans isomerase C
MKKNATLIAKLGTGLLVITLFSGCKFITDLFKKAPAKEKVTEVQEVEKEEGTGEVLLNIDGKPVLKESDFDKHLTQMLQVNPYFRGAGVDSLPMAIKRKFFDELVKQELILAWADKNRIEDDAEFIKSFAEMKALVKRSLLVQRFESKIFEDISVSDNEVKDHFNQNKEKFVKEPGGVLISGIKFEDEEKADSFLDKAKGKKSDDFIALAQKDKDGKFKDFGRVSKEKKGIEGADIPNSVKDRAFSLKNFPAIDKVKVGKNFWVIHASDKKEAEVFDFDEVKPQLEVMLRNNKFREELDKHIKELKGEFTIDVNEDFFKDNAPKLPEGVKIKTKEEVEAEAA